MTVDLSILSPSVRRRIERRTADLLRFATPHSAKAVPAALRHNLTREGFLALTVEQREAHIRARVPAMVLAERAERAERRAAEQAAAEAAVAEPTVAPSIAPAFRPGELFAISDDSGEWAPLAVIRREEASARAAKADARRLRRAWLAERRAA